jgi:chemotaxis protein methyltransferase CheR
VARGSFRQDLFYRLNVFPIYIPSLREHKEDIPLLAHYFVDKYSRKLGKRIKRIPADEMKKLFDYHWPGNVRELEHFIERAVIFSDGHRISFSSFEYRPKNESIPIDDSCTSSLAEVERDYIKRVLQKTRWKIYGRGGAASILDLKPSSLQSRMKKLGIRHPVRESGDGNPTEA